MQPADQTSMWKWCHAVAHDRTMTCPNLTEDAAQEGMIGWYEAWQSRPGHLEYCKAAAKNKIVGFITGHNHPTGAPSRQGRRQVDEKYLSADESMDSYARTYDMVEAEMAYHRREINKVLTELTPRQKTVVAKISLGDPLTSSQRGEWSGRLRPRLAEKLNHLRLDR